MAKPSKIIQIGRPRLYNVLSNEKFADGLSEKAEFHGIFGKQISTVWKPKYSPTLKNSQHIWGGFSSRERYERNFLGPLTAGFGNGSFRYPIMRIYLPEKRERKKASSDDSISINHPSLFQIGRNSPRNPFLSHQHDPLQSPSVAGSQEDEPPDVETFVTWQRFGKPLKLGQVSRSQVVGFLKHQQLGDETLLKFRHGELRWIMKGWIEMPSRNRLKSQALKLLLKNYWFDLNRAISICQFDDWVWRQC